MAEVFTAVMISAGVLRVPEDREMFLGQTVQSYVQTRIHIMARDCTVVMGIEI